MSTLPPNVIVSALQSTFAQQQTSAVRDSERMQRVGATQRQTQAIDEQDAIVETTDNDTQVHTDAEGSGSQGRQFSEPEPQPETPASETDTDLDGHFIDVEI